VIQPRPARRPRPRIAATAIGTAALLAVAACSATSGSSPGPAPNVTKSTTSLRSVAQALAGRDHSPQTAAYLSVVRQLATSCHAASPAAVESLVSGSLRRLISHGPTPGSRLSVMRILAARATPNGPPGQCQQAVSELLHEVTGIAGSGSSYGGFGATVTAFAAAHRRDPARPSAFLPRLPDGKDSFAATGSGRVTSMVRSFDPTLPQGYALAVVRRQLLPAGSVHRVYSLPSAHCSETIYLNSTLGSLLGSSTAGVMIELTSGRGVSSHYDPGAVNRARLTVGGRIGGQPCV
jgi:hypothetical protein